MKNIRRIQELLDRDPAAFAIVAYLSRHTQAMDTAWGIAEWWIQMEVGPTLDALTRLHDLEVVRCSANGASTLYAYTRDPRLQSWLLRYVERQEGLRTGSLRG